MTRKQGPCGLCGVDPIRGSAGVSAGDEWIDLCHPDDGQDCYHLWTVWKLRPCEPLVVRGYPTYRHSWVPGAESGDRCLCGQRRLDIPPPCDPPGPPTALRRHLGGA